MTKELEYALERFIEIMKQEKGIKGAWNLGSITRGLSDKYSNVNIVFLVKGEEFKKVDDKVSEYLQQVCDEVVLCQPESFNSDAISNTEYLLKKEQQLMQIEVVILNEDKLDDAMCRMYYTDLSMEQVVFDSEGCVQKLLDESPKGDKWQSDLEKLNATYWFNINMSIKYLKRKDFFKLHYLMRSLMDTHVALLLNGYDKISWGNMVNKLQYLPEKMQEHIMYYRCTEDFVENISILWRVMNWFEDDYNEVCKIKGVEADNRLAPMVEEFWIDCM